jgi:hypothetical protein
VARQDRPHRVQRLDRDNFVAGRQQRRRQASGPGAEVEDPRPAGRPADDVYDVRVVPGSAALVCVGDPAEAACQVCHPNRITRRPSGGGATASLAAPLPSSADRTTGGRGREVKPAMHLTQE